MATWILIYSFLVPNNLNFNKPIIMDVFTTRQQCEATLYYIESNYKEAGIQGSGQCWGEEK